MGVTATIAFIFLALTATAPAGAPPQGAAGGTVADFTAVSANVRDSGRPVTIQVLDWSSEAELGRLVMAMNPPPPAPEPEGGRGRGGRGGRGGFGGGFGGRGGGAPAEPEDPVLAALEESRTVGYFWTSGGTGYSVKYAYRSDLPGGGERIVLATDRRIGAYNTAWEPVTTDYEFSVIDIRLNAGGQGEAKASLTTDVILTDGVLALADYDGTPSILEQVRRQ